MAGICRIYIAGDAGAGKTTLLKRLTDSTGYPSFELDALLWTENSTGERIHEAERITIIRDIAIQPRWIADGAYVGWAQELWHEADLIIYLDISLKLMLWRVFWRHTKAEFKRNNRHPGWFKLFKFMRFVARSARSTEVGNIDDDEDDVLTHAKILAKVQQQHHKVLKVGANPDIEQILALINSK